MALILTSLFAIATQPRIPRQTAIHKINLLDTTTALSQMSALPGERFSLGPQRPFVPIRVQSIVPPMTNPVDQQANRRESSAGDALNIFLDEQGRPTVPSPSQLAAAQSALKPMTGKTPVKTEPVIAKSPVKGGGEYARLNGRFRSATIATVNADGSISLHEQSQATGPKDRQVSQSSLTGLNHE